MVKAFNEGVKLQNAVTDKEEALHFKTINKLKQLEKD